jgi:hypothetical protein
MDRKLLKLPFRGKSIPERTCPTCSKGILRIKEDSFRKDEISRSCKAREHDAWEPEWIEYIYTCILACSNDKCGEVVASSGTGSVDWDVVEEFDGNYEQVHTDLFFPKYFVPHLHLFNLPDDCPPRVSSLLHESFRIFFSSPKAAANSVRAAIEELLTELKIKRFSTARGKRRRMVPLHDRINLLPAKYDQVKEMIFAIKWLGNAGSHGHTEVSMDDVMDAYELTEYILEFIFEPKAQSLAAIAKKVNKKKGPA